MEYPIFNVITNYIKNELEHRNITLKNFKTWEQPQINASGFEICIDIDRSDSLIRSMHINWDWDTFREYKLASQLKGMEAHPLLSKENLNQFAVEPTVDIEISWEINEEAIQEQAHSNTGNERLDAARNWMNYVNEHLSPLFSNEQLINRWHIEIDGDLNGRFLSSIFLISYLQYSFIDLTELDQVQRYIEKKLQQLFLMSNRVIKLVNNSAQSAA